MPTRGQKSVLESAAQDILYDYDFGRIRTRIENATSKVREPYSRARLCKLPIAAAFGNMVGARAMRLIQDGIVPEVSPDFSAHDRYLALTADIDQTAGQAVIAHLDDLGPNFTAAFQYYADQIEIIRKIKATTPQVATRRGKVLERPADTPSRYLDDQQSINAGRTTLSVLIRETVRICLSEGALPASNTLARNLRSHVGELSQFATLQGQIWARFLMGEKLVEEWHDALQTEAPLEVPAWHEILRQQIEQGTLHPLAHELAKPLSESLATECAKTAALKTDGHCPAPFALVPHDAPAGPINRDYAIGYFASQGIILTDGAFKMSEYQLLRGIEVGQETIFADESYRRAFESIARGIQEAM